MNDMKCQSIDWHFYVQDERYVTVPWMAKSDDVQASLRHPVF
jgi:hypothetical protein